MGLENRKRVLIVEDSEDLRYLMEVYLEGEGYDVSSVANGKEALDYLHSRAELPSVILLDLMMPVMDGFQFRREQQRDSRLSPIPVVLMTAGQDIKGDAARIHADAFLKKPIDIDDLRYAVDHVFETHAPH